MSLQTARTIDVHAHVLLDEVMRAAGTCGPEILFDSDTPVFRVGDYRLRNMCYRGSAFMDPELRVARMNDADIDSQLLSPNPLTYFHFIPAADAIAFCRAHNDALAALVARYPDRLGGLVALPVQDVTAAATLIFAGWDQPRHVSDLHIDVDLAGNARRLLRAA